MIVGSTLRIARSRGIEKDIITVRSSKFCLRRLLTSCSHIFFWVNWLDFNSRARQQSCGKISNTSSSSGIRSVSKPGIPAPALRPFSVSIVIASARPCPSVVRLTVPSCRQKIWPSDERRKSVSRISAPSRKARWNAESVFSGQATLLPLWAITYGFVLPGMINLELSANSPPAI